MARSIRRFGFATAALAALTGWARERDAVAKLERQRRSTDELERRLREQQEALQRERRTRLRVERARRAEREWSRELREQVLTLHRRQGAIDATEDLHELLLRTSIELVGAEKGLLLSKGDRDGDGRLDVVTHRGFDHDPAASDLAQRFAERVLERDEIVREDEPTPGRSPADGEIGCLVAVPVYMHDDFEGVVVCANRPGGFEELEDDVLLALGDHAGTALENARLHGRARATYVAVVRMLSDSIAAKDPFARAHSGRLCAYVDGVAKQLGLDGRAREALTFAVLLHDVGKLGISERILLKPGRLTEAEWDVVRLHPQIGCRIVERVPGLEPLAPAVRHHHERWDGAGYPAGLAGTDIPLAARIVAVADAFGAMVAGRPYCPSTSPESACQEIERCAGTQFDPEVAELFVAEVRRHPLGDSDDSPVADALEEPAVRARRRQDEPVLGHGPVGAIDNVTLLYSHRYLMESTTFEAERAGRQRRPFAVVMVELADLSAINGREGYEAGDAALHEVARAFERATAETTATVGRYSGRRLVAVMPKTGQQAASAVVEHLVRDLDGGPAVRTGVAVWQHGDAAETVLFRARLALEGAAMVGVADLGRADNG